MMFVSAYFKTFWEHTGRYTTPRQQIRTDWSNISCTGKKLTKLIEKSPSWKANTQVHYCTHKNLRPVPIMSQTNLVNVLHPMSWRSILMSSHHLCLGLPPRSCMHLSFSPYVLHDPPISFFFIWSPKYFVSTDHKVSHNVVFPTPP